MTTCFYDTFRLSFLPVCFLKTSLMQVQNLINFKLCFAGWYDSNAAIILFCEELLIVTVHVYDSDDLTFDVGAVVK